MARLAAAAAALAGAAAASTSTGASNVKYVIVVMMENRSFDHMLGHLAAKDPRIDGLNGTQTQPLDPTDPNSQRVPVNYNAVDGGPVDPKHDFDSITTQVYGFAKPVSNKTAAVMMDGFAVTATDGQVAFVMSAFNDTTLPVLSALASEFAVFDHYHCSIPTCTNPNREMLMSGTSHGWITNDFPSGGFPQQTHFTFLEGHGIDWKIYYNDDPWMAPAFADLRTASSLAKIQEMPAFFADLSGGTLPRYSLIQPRMATSASGPSNWQHPDNSIEAGEAFYRDIYTALRASSYWEETLLIITYDEHGGFPDHQPTPTVGVPSPDGLPAPNGFAFDRLGVRVPMVMISPWIPRNTVVGPPTGARAPTPTSQFEHTSVIASANRIFGIADNMTDRDAWAGTFHDLVGAGAVLRTDCPTELPPVRPLPAGVLAAEMAMPWNDHHRDSINLLCELAGRAHDVCARAGAPPAAGEWAAWPHLDAAVAARMTQQHFGAISGGLWAAYKRAVVA